MTLIKSIRKIAHLAPKNFGYREDKWARGGKGNGYARSYGHNSPAYSDNRTRAEIQNNDARKKSYTPQSLDHDG